MLPEINNRPFCQQMGYETIDVDVDSGYLSKLLETAREGHVRSLDRWMNDQLFRDRQIDLETTKDLGIARYLSSLLEDNRERYYTSGSLHGYGDYVVKTIPTPADEGWGVSRPAGNGPSEGLSLSGSF